MELSKKFPNLTTFGVVCLLVMCLTYLNPQLAQAEVDTVKVVNYEQDLDNISGSPTATGKYVVIAKDLYFKTFTEQDSPETRDAAFLIFYKYYNKIVDEAYKDEVFFNASIMEPEQVRKAEEVAASYGWRVITPEGNVQPNADNAYLARTFGNIVSPYMKAYLSFARKTEHMAEDAALRIEPDEIRERIILGENLIKVNPDSIIAAKIKPVLDDLFYYYLFGLDNTPVYGDSVQNQINPNTKSSYQRFLKENKNSKYYPLIKATYDVLKKNNFIYSNKVKSAISNNLKKMREI